MIFFLLKFLERSLTLECTPSHEALSTEGDSAAILVLYLCCGSPRILAEGTVAGSLPDARSK